MFYSGSSIFMVSVPGVMIQYHVGQEMALMGLSLYVLSCVYLCGELDLNYR